MIFGGITQAFHPHQQQLDQMAEEWDRIRQQAALNAFAGSRQEQVQPQPMGTVPGDQGRAIIDQLLSNADLRIGAANRLGQRNVNAINQLFPHYPVDVNALQARDRAESRMDAPAIAQNRSGDRLALMKAALERRNQVPGRKALVNELITGNRKPGVRLGRDITDNPVMGGGQQVGWTTEQDRRNRRWDRYQRTQAMKDRMATRRTATKAMMEAARSGDAAEMKRLRGMYWGYGDALDRASAVGRRQARELVEADRLAEQERLANMTPEERKVEVANQFRLKLQKNQLEAAAKAAEKNIKFEEKKLTSTEKHQQAIQQLQRDSLEAEAAGRADLAVHRAAEIRLRERQLTQDKEIADANRKASSDERRLSREHEREMGILRMDAEPGSRLKKYQDRLAASIMGEDAGKPSYANEVVLPDAQDAAKRAVSVLPDTATRLRRHTTGVKAAAEHVLNQVLAKKNPLQRRHALEVLRSLDKEVPKDMESHEKAFLKLEKEWKRKNRIKARNILKGDFTETEEVEKPVVRPQTGVFIDRP